MLGVRTRAAPACPRTPRALTHPPGARTPLPCRFTLGCFVYEAPVSHTKAPVSYTRSTCFAHTKAPVSYTKHLFRIRKHLCHIRSTLVHIRTTWFIYEPLIRIRTTHLTETTLALHMNTRRQLTMVSNIAMGSNTVLSGLKYGPQAQIRSHPQCHI